MQWNKVQDVILILGSSREQAHKILHAENSGKLVICISDNIEDIELLYNPMYFSEEVIGWIIEHW